MNVVAQREINKTKTKQKMGRDRKKKSVNKILKKEQTTAIAAAKQRVSNVTR